MMNQLCIQDNDIITVQNVSLPLATYSKFQPQTVDFLDIHNPKAVYPTVYHNLFYVQVGGYLHCTYFNSYYCRSSM